jgi:hypothetical protein
MISGEGFDRRRALRYPIASIIWVADARAVTMDLSSTGVYFAAEWPFTVGEEVPLVLAFEHSAPSRTRVICKARIVRVDPRLDGFLVAAAYEPIRFEIDDTGGL